MLHRIFKPKQDDQRSQTIWLTVYADLMTNLMLVFLALFGLIVMGEDAIMKAMQSMRLEANPEARLNFEDFSEVLEGEFKDIVGITVTQEADATRIKFGEAVLFKSGEAKLKKEAAPILGELANFLQIIPFTVVVEGHTDNVPIIPGSHFKTNRELALARSMSVVDVLSERGRLNPDQLAAAAYGSFRPDAPNETVEGRQLNRRVEIALFKDFPYEL